MPVAKRKIATKRKPTIAEERALRIHEIAQGHLQAVAVLSKKVKERLDELDQHSALRMQNYKALADKVEGLIEYGKQLRSNMQKLSSDLAVVESRQDNIDKAQLDVKNKLAEAKFYDARKISDHVAQLEVRTKQLGVDVVKLQNGRGAGYEDSPISIGAISWSSTGETAY